MLGRDLIIKFTFQIAAAGFEWAAGLEWKDVSVAGF
jgi:hypothetical protein